MLLPLDAGAGRSAVQSVGSTTTYGKRYVMCALLNITSGDDNDNDGHSQAPEPAITAVQVKQLESMAAKCSQRAQEAFSKLYPEIGEITKSQFDTVLNQLTTSAAKNKEAAQ